MRPRTLVPGTSIVAALEAEVDRQLDTNRPVVQYIRRSTETQKNKNLMALVQQDTKLGERLIGRGFSRIEKIDTDDGKSGQRLLEDRAGLTYLYDLVKGRRFIDGQRISAVAAYDGSRLWRDTTRVWYNEFIQLLIKYDVPFITWKRTYWPGDKADMDALRQEFEGALQSLATITDRANPARLLAVNENGSYGGHAVPPGFYVTGIKTDRHYAIYEPHRKLIVYLFQRFKALNGNKSRLLRELEETGFCFPEYDLETPPHLSLPHVKGIGYFVRTRAALGSILTNTAYIGWYTFTTHEKTEFHYDEKKHRRVKGVGKPVASYINEKAHDPIIVDRSLFEWCYEKITGTRLDGTVVQQKPECRYGVQTNALLEGLLTCNGYPVYAMAGTNTYVAREYANDWKSTEIVVPIATVDDLFSMAMNMLFRWPDMRDCDELAARIEEVRQDVRVRATDYESKLAAIDQAIVGWEMDKQSAREKGYKAGLDKANEQLATLERQRSEVVAAMNRTTTDDEKLTECMDLLQQTTSGFTCLSHEGQRRLARLLIEEADIREVTPHILRMVVSLGIPINQTITLHYFRSRGSKPAWTDEEKALLTRLYPSSDRATILRAIPNRTWESCQYYASNELHLARTNRTNSSSIPDDTTYADFVLMEELGMEDRATKMRLTAYHATPVDSEHQLCPPSKESCQMYIS